MEVLPMDFIIFLKNISKEKEIDLSKIIAFNYVSARRNVSNNIII